MFFYYHIFKYFYSFFKDIPNSIPKGELTKFAQAMPEEYKVGDAVESYRNYYRGAKSGFANWKMRDIPEWFLLNQ